MNMKFGMKFVICVLCMVLSVGSMVVMAQDEPQTSQPQLYLPMVNDFSDHSGVTPTPTLTPAEPEVVIAISSISNLGDPVISPEASIDSCYDSIPRLGQVTGSGLDSLICLLPGKYLTVQTSTNHQAVLGNNSPNNREAWSQDQIQGTNHFADQVIVQPNIVNFSESVGGFLRTAGPITMTTTDFSVIKLTIQDDPLQAAAVDQMPLWYTWLEFATLLRDYIKSTETLLLNVDRTIPFYDDTSLNAESAETRGCGSGTYVEWVAIGPIKIITFGSQVRLLFAGAFNQPTDSVCMGVYKNIEVSVLYAVPELRNRVDSYRTGGGNPQWNWDLGGGLQRAFTFLAEQPYVYFAIRYVPEGTFQAVTNLYLIIPSDFMDVSCLTLQGQTACLIDQTREPGTSTTYQREVININAISH